MLLLLLCVLTSCCSVCSLPVFPMCSLPYIPQAHFLLSPCAHFPLFHRLTSCFPYILTSLCSTGLLPVLPYAHFLLFIVLNSCCSMCSLPVNLSVLLNCCCIFCLNMFAWKRTTIWASVEVFLILHNIPCSGKFSQSNIFCKFHRYPSILKIFDSRNLSPSMYVHARTLHHYYFV